MSKTRTFPTPYGVTFIMRLNNFGIQARQDDIRERHIDLLNRSEKDSLEYRELNRGIGTYALLLAHTEDIQFMDGVDLDPYIMEFKAWWEAGAKFEGFLDFPQQIIGLWTLARQDRALQVPAFQRHPDDLSAAERDQAEDPDSPLVKSV